MGAFQNVDSDLEMYGMAKGCIVSFTLEHLETAPADSFLGLCIKHPGKLSSPWVAYLSGSAGVSKLVFLNLLSFKCKEKTIFPQVNSGEKKL